MSFIKLEKLVKTPRGGFTANVNLSGGADEKTITVSAENAAVAMRRFAVVLAGAVFAAYFFKSVIALVRLIKALKPE